MTNIDYGKVSRAVSLYREKGYKYIDAPWIVGPEALSATLPRGKSGFYLGHPELPSTRFLVGSAEQGFLQLMLDGELEPGSYCAAGPCFRDDEEDELHQLSFFKLELIRVYAQGEQPELLDAYMMAHAAHRAHVDLLYLNERQRPLLSVKRTEGGYDLELGGVEVGSYGVRELDGRRWLYGTGLALPRAQIARSRLVSAAT